MEGTRMLKLLPERILAILQDIELVADCRPADLSTPVRTILELVNALPGGRDNPEISTWVRDRCTDAFAQLDQEETKTRKSIESLDLSKLEPAPGPVVPPQLEWPPAVGSRIRFRTWDELLDDPEVTHAPNDRLHVPSDGNFRFYVGVKGFLVHKEWSELGKTYVVAGVSSKGSIQLEGTKGWWNHISKLFEVVTDIPVADEKPKAIKE